MIPEDITSQLSHWLSSFSDKERIIALNRLQQFLHQYSPFQDEPLSCIQWVPAEALTANDYNPNTMTPVEKKLLELSLIKDGFTQPVVVTGSGPEVNQYQVVDGYHRFMLSQKPALRKRLLGHVPVACIRAGCDGPAGLMATTIRHNRARGQHRVAAMSDIVRDLSRLGWNDERIGKELGMNRMKFYG